jgi:hypothetical protein
MMFPAVMLSICSIITGFLLACMVIDCPAPKIRKIQSSPCVGTISRAEAQAAVKAVMDRQKGNRNDSINHK